MKRFALIAATMATVLTAGMAGAAPSYETGPTSCFYTLNGKKDVCYTAYRDCAGCGWYWDAVVISVIRGAPGTAHPGWLFASEGNTDLAYAHPVRRGRWSVSRAADQGGGYLGSVQRPSATRWDVYHKGRLMGYTKGPNPAVVGLFVLCRYL